jgi:hypothetical protein
MDKQTTNVNGSAIADVPFEIEIKVIVYKKAMIKK